MSYSYDRRIAKELNLSHWDLDGMIRGEPTTLYHGTTKLFRKFDLSLVKEELVNNYYGGGVFLTPSKRVASSYANANRNIGFDPSIIADLKRRNPPAGELMQTLYSLGKDGWDVSLEAGGFVNENPAPGEGAIDYVGYQKHLGVDPNTIDDIAGYIIGSKIKPLGSGIDDPLDLFSQSSTGAPSHVYDSLDEVGLDSKTYRPKVYTVTVTVSNTLVTANKAQARKARSKGFDSVIYHGSDLVAGVPEVAVFDPRKVRIKRIEID